MKKMLIRWEENTYSREKSFQYKKAEYYTNQILNDGDVIIHENVFNHFLNNSFYRIVVKSKISNLDMITSSGTEFLKEMDLR